MKITYAISQTKYTKPIHTAIQDYRKRLTKYCKIDNNNKYTNAYQLRIGPSGRKVTSFELAKMIETIQVSGYSHIYISQDITTYDDFIQVVSCTLSNELLELLTLEQLYRAFKIINHEPYHK